SGFTAYSLLADELNETDQDDDQEEFASDRDYGSEESDSDLNDYSSDASDSEPETERELPPALVEASSTHPSADPGTAESSLVPDGSRSPEPNEEANAKINEVTTELLASQLQDYQWIKSTVDDATIEGIVKETRTAQYDYCPRVFYVDKEDFDSWLERDGRDHFFAWMLRKHQDNKPGGRSKFFMLKPTNTTVDMTHEAKPSMKVGCTAKLIVHNMKDDSEDPKYAIKNGRKQLRVMYFYKHTGHVLGNVDDFQYLTMTESTRARIRNLVRLGLCTRAIIAKVNLAGPQAYSLHKQGRLQHDHVLTYEDVYNIQHKYMSKLTKLSDDDMESMSLWMSKLHREKHFTVFTESSIKDPLRMSPIPVAFLLTNDHTHHSLKNWLIHIKDMVGTPEFITTDDAQVEYQAIRKAFGKDVTIHLCLWHVIKAGPASSRP
ncbi:hypothetical protein BX616_001500, partial [Lobosporangium transversale]